MPRRRFPIVNDCQSADTGKNPVFNGLGGQTIEIDGEDVCFANPVLRFESPQTNLAVVQRGFVCRGESDASSAQAHSDAHLHIHPPSVTACECSSLAMALARTRQGRAGTY